MIIIQILPHCFDGLSKVCAQDQWFFDVAIVVGVAAVSGCEVAAAEAKLISNLLFKLLKIF